MNSRDILLVASARRLAATGEGRRVRAAAGLSLREVAAAIGTGSTTLWRWERGERVPRGAPAIAWAELMHQLSKAAAVAS